jgi:diadenosine tetraphosphate (Ap4A) HIT family hydrolase
MNATIEKFGYPGSLVKELEHWVILLRPAQATLGALVLAAKSDVAQFSALPADAFTELAIGTYAIEQGLSRFQPYDKINYLMLMMVDPHVHFHVLPRYAGIPDLKHQNDVGKAERGLLLDAMRQAFSVD